MTFQYVSIVCTDTGLQKYVYVQYALVLLRHIDKKPYLILMRMK